MQEKEDAEKTIFCFNHIAVSGRQKKINVLITTIDKHKQALKSHTSYPRPHITLFQFWTSVVVRWKLLALNFSSASSLPTYTLTIFSLTPAPCFKLPFFLTLFLFLHLWQARPEGEPFRDSNKACVTSSMLKNIFNISPHSELAT